MGKRNGSKLFKFDVNDEAIYVICYMTSNRNGFYHHAEIVNNCAVSKHSRIHYINRTWESFMFESVLRKLSGKYFIGKELEEINIQIDRFARGLGRIAAVNPVCAI